MNKILTIILIILLASCRNTDSNLKEASGENEIIPWENNQLLQWKGDSMKSIFYWDTLTSIGPLKYTCLHYNNGDAFYGESVVLEENESYPDFIKRLSNARTQYHDNCIECGDFDYWFGTKQNLEIITFHALIKMEQLDSAQIYLNVKSKEWRNSSRYSDLYLALLLKTIGRIEIESRLESIKDLEKQDSILMEDHWIHWQPINEYNFKLYQNEISWSHYFMTTMKRIEQKGI